MWEGPLSRQYISSIQSTNKSRKTVMEPQLYIQSRIAFTNSNRLALLNSPLTSNDHSSKSFVLTLAEYLNTLRGLVPPGFTPLLKKKSSSYAKLAQLEPSYFEAWCDYLFGLVCEGSILARGDEVVLVGRLDEEAFKVVENSGVFEMKANAEGVQQKLAVNSAINLLKDTISPSSLPLSKKIAIINFSSSILNQDKLKPRIHLEGLLAGIFYNPGDSWRSFRVLKNDVPKAEELAQYDTVILSGSSYSVNSLAPQMELFQQVLMDALSLNAKLKVLGICFGHQFIANAKSIEVVTKSLNKGLQNINFSFQDHTEAEYLHDFLKSELRYLRLYKYHSDHVTSVPQLFTKFGESSKCNLESLISKDKRILSFQFHPEYTEEYIHAYEERLTKYFRPEYHVQSHKKRDDFHHKSTEIMRKTMRRFINWNMDV